VEPNNKAMALAQRRRLKPLAILVALVHVHSILVAPTILALTGGPSQPEVQSFEPISNTDLVNPFTGDFTYNIPLMDVGGYPLNLTYHSGITMDQEASFVGLGWNLSPGVINRQVRGLPDDFAGEEIEKHLNLRTNVTTGGTVGLDLEVFGYSGPLVQPNVYVDVNYNTYRGVGVDLGFKAAVMAAEGGKTSLTADLGVSSNSGITLSPRLSFAHNEKTAEGDARLGASLGLNWNSREGLQAITLNPSAEMRWRQNGRSNSLSKEVSHSFVNPTFTPSIRTPMANFSGTVRLKMGLEVFGLTGNLDVAGYRSIQEVAEPEYALPAYGFLYAHRAGEATRVLHDFNREGDDSFVPTQPKLPVTQLTYDLYAVSGQGMQGQFRPFRSDVGTVFDPEVVLSGLQGFNVGLEAGGGNSLKVGTDLMVNLVNSRAGKWTTSNAMRSILRFRGKDPNNAAFEPVYFKQIGEATAMSQSNAKRFGDFGGFDPVRVGTNDQSALAQLVKRTPAELKRSTIEESSPILGDRQARNLHFSYLTAAEATEVGLEKTLRNYVRFWEDPDDLETVKAYLPRYEKPIPRVSPEGGPRQPHHISEVTVTRDDGTRYVYGLPLYNIKKEEVSFNVSVRDTEEDTEEGDGLVTYTIGEDDSQRNTRGTNHMYNKVVTPPYAYAYRLTAIVSGDYVDVTGDGPTSDDLGTYTKFNYHRYHTNYRWRTPFTNTYTDAELTGTAFFQQGHRSDPEDNLGSYVYGEKEIWHLHSVETKNYIAEFELLPRKDGVAIADEGGGLPTRSAPTPQILQKLNQIRLYNKAERLSQKDRAVPLKTVHFFYDYSLCNNVPNALDGVGKLTLTRVAFSYRNSEKAMLSPYVFTYAEENPNYDRQASDRWGTYKPNTSDFPNRRFPYATQKDRPMVDRYSRALVDRYASAWHLTGIRLPSGGQLRVEYEADDYAYVQDRRAMQMYPIVATGQIANTPVDSGQLYNDDSNFLYFFFELLHPIPAVPGRADEACAPEREDEDCVVLKEYVKGMEELYVNAEVRVANEGAEKNQYEEIQTFLPLHRQQDDGLPSHGFDESTQVSCGPPGFESTVDCYTRAWIKIAQEPLQKGGLGELVSDVAEIVGDSTQVHPLAQATWQYIKLNLPRIAYKQPGKDLLRLLEEKAEGGEVTDAMEAMVEVVPKLMAETWDLVEKIVTSFNEEMMDQERANRMKLPQSFMRLNHPTKSKIGGGSRVKRVSLNDQWGRMTERTETLTNPMNYDYKKEFSYTMTEQWDERTREISSGVAAYEPLLGGDENPFVQPLWYEHNKDRLFQVEPIGESLFPGPVVGYRQVKVRHLTPTVEKEDPHVLGTGSTVYEFYTAKDFPVVVRQASGIRDRNSELKLIQPFPSSEDHMAVSQGFAIELNDMHGKAKATWVYQEGDATMPISGVSYKYLTPPSQSETSQLLNRVSTLVKTADSIKLEKEYIGIDYDIIVDMREHQTTVTAPGVELNVDGFPIGALGNVPSAFSQESTRFRSAVMTKVIHRSGLLSEVRAYDSGASLATFNEIWDAETGQVLVTRVETEHGTSRYTTRIPAHFETPGMGGAWTNQGLTLQNVRVGPKGILDAGKAGEFFFPGDELLLEPPNNLKERDPASPPPNAQQAWVWQVDKDRVILLDREGNHIPAGEFALVKIVRSGHRNQQTASVGQVATLAPPVTEESDPITFQNVIDASALEYAQHWQTYGVYQASQSAPSCNCRPLDFRMFDTSLSLLDPYPSHVALRDLLKELQDQRLLGQRDVDLRTALADDTAGLERARLGELRGYLDEHVPGWHIWESRFEGSFFHGRITDEEGNPVAHVTLRHPSGMFKEGLVNELNFSTMDYRRDFRYECGTSGKFALFAGDAAPPRQQLILGESDRFPIAACGGEQTEMVHAPAFQCNITVGEAVNPYVHGLLGNWRPRRAWSYLTDRVSSSRRMEAGTYDRFEPFWSRFSGNSDEHWHWTEETTVVNPYGRALESHDALGRYQAELYGFDFNVVMAGAQNARPAQMAVDSFEDYAYTNRLEFDAACPAPRHWSFQDSDSADQRDVAQSHTGRYSLRLDRESVNLARPLEPLCSTTPTDQTGPLYYLQRCDMITPFSPTPGRYIVSAWVKTRRDKSHPADPVPVAGPAIEIAVDRSRTRIEPKGIAVDGWQRMMGEFSIPPGATVIDVTLKSETVLAWFDDIRIHPFEAQMEGYVYDPVDLRFRATLDANNYSTFYDYDEEGALARLKQETIEGRMTIREVSRGVPKFSWSP
jgi:hypothetical protein